MKTLAKIFEKQASEREGHLKIPPRVLRCWRLKPLEEVAEDIRKEPTKETLERKDSAATERPIAKTAATARPYHTPYRETNLEIYAGSSYDRL